MARLVFFVMFFSIALPSAICSGRRSTTPRCGLYVVRSLYVRPEIQVSRILPQKKKQSVVCCYFIGPRKTQNPNAQGRRRSPPNNTSGVVCVIQTTAVDPPHPHPTYTHIRTHSRSLTHKPNLTGTQTTVLHIETALNVIVGIDRRLLHPPSPYTCADKRAR